MISVGVDSKSLWSQVYQSADQENDENITDNTDLSLLSNDTLDNGESTEDPEKADPVYSQENLELKLESARIHFEKFYDEDPMKKLYDTNKIFDVVKIITSTIMGEPRLTFKAPRFEKHFYAYNRVAAVRTNRKEGLKEKFLYVVDTTGLSYTNHEDINYIENITYDKKEFTSIPEVAKLLNKFGEYSLKMLAGLLIGINDSGKKEPVKTNVRVAYAKLAVAMAKYENTIKETLGLYEDGLGLYGSIDDRVYKTLNELDFSKFTDLANFYDNFRDNGGNSRIEFVDVIAYLYSGLACYLTGAMINFSDKAGLTIATLFDKDTVKEGVKTFIDRISSVIEDKDVENKLLSLFYTFYLIHNFYETNSSVKIDDIFTLPACTIGNAIANMNDKVFNDELIDITELTHGDLPEYKLNFRAYLDTPSVLKDTAYAMSLIPEYDTPSKSLVAAKVFDLFKFVHDEKFEEIPFAPLCGTALANTQSSDYSETNLEKFYFYFLHSLIDELPLVCSPRNFYKIALCAVVFRAAKFFTTGDSRKIAAFGLYQAEGYLIYLFREWFKSGKLYKIDDSVKGNYDDESFKTLQKKAMMYCAHILSELSFEATYLEPRDTRNFDLKQMELKFSGFDIPDYEIDPIDLVVTDYPPEAVMGVSGSNPEDFFDFISQFNKGSISFANLLVDGKDDQNIFRINQTLENDYNQETIDKLGELKEGTEDLDTETISKLPLAKCIAKHIDKVIKNENSKERFDVFFNSFLKGPAMIVLAKDSYTHLLTDQKESVLFVDKNLSGSNEENYLSLLPHVQSMRTFNFLNRN